MKEIAVESFELFLILGSFAAIIVGIFLFLRPEIIRQVNERLNKWYSSRKSMKPLEIMRETDHYIYRYNKTIGWIMLLGSFYALLVFINQLFINSPLTTPAYTNYMDVLLDITIVSIKLFFIVFIVGGLPLWILLIVAPEKLKKISLFFNRWISTRLFLLPLEQMHGGFDTYVLKHNRVFGIIFVVGSILIMFFLRTMINGL